MIFNCLIDQYRREVCGESDFQETNVNISAFLIYPFINYRSGREHMILNEIEVLKRLSKGHSSIVTLWDCKKK